MGVILPSHSGRFSALVTNPRIQPGIYDGLLSALNDIGVAANSNGGWVTR